MSNPLDEILARKREAEAKIEAARKELKEAGTGVLKDLLAPLFEKFPEVAAVSWTQYTPYFNDGDPCTFRSNHDEPAVLDKEDAENEEWDAESFDWESEEFKMARELLGALSEDDMEDLFGDGYRIIVTRDGVDVEEYDHH